MVCRAVVGLRVVVAHRADQRVRPQRRRQSAAPRTGSDASAGAPRGRRPSGRTASVRPSRTAAPRTARAAGYRKLTGLTRCGASRVSISSRSRSASWTSPNSSCSRYRRPPWNSFEERDDVPEARVPCLDQRHPQPSGRRVQCRTGPDHTAADHQHVEVLPGQLPPAGLPLLRPQPSKIGIAASSIVLPSALTPSARNATQPMPQSAHCPAENCAGDPTGTHRDRPATQRRAERGHPTYTAPPNATRRSRPPSNRARRAARRCAARCPGSDPSGAAPRRS